MADSPAESAPMSGERALALAGLFTLSLSTTGLSTVLARLYSVALGKELAPLALALPLWGSALGLLAVPLLRPKSATPLAKRLVGCSGFGTVFGVVAVIMGLRSKLGDPESATWREFFELLCLSLPAFVLKGFVFGVLCSRRASARASFFATDGLGMLVGGPLAMALLSLGAPRAGLLFSCGFGLAAVLFAVSLSRSALTSAAERRTTGFQSAAFFLAGLMLLWGDYGETWLEAPKLRTLSVSRTVLLQWSSSGLLSMDKPASTGFAWVATDGNRTAVHTQRAAPKLPEHMAYAAVQSDGPILVLGAGHGRDVRAALDAGRTQVVAVEPNAALRSAVLSGKLAEQMNQLFSRPEVSLIGADPRSFVSAADERFDVIVVPGIDSGVVPHARGLAAAETTLFTREAFRSFLDALSADGLLVVRRWDPDLGKLLRLAAAELGPEAKRHLYACSHSGSTALVIKRSALSQEELGRLRDYCAGQRFNEVFAPDLQNQELLEAAVLRPFDKTARARVSVPSDDSPGFFLERPFAELVALAVSPRRAFAAGPVAAFPAVQWQFLAALALIFVALRSVAVLRSSKRTMLGWGALLSFAAGGFGVALVEQALVGRLTSLIGGQHYALMVVLPSFLGAAALSALTRRPMRSLTPVRTALLASIAAVVCSLLIGLLATALEGGPLVLRVLWVVLLSGFWGWGVGKLSVLLMPFWGNISETEPSHGLFAGALGAAVALSLGPLLALYAGNAFLFLLAALGFFVCGAALAASKLPSPAR